MTIQSIAAEAAKALEVFNKCLEEDSRPPQQLNAADRMRQGPRAIPEYVPNIGSQISRASIGRFNPSDINGRSRPGLQRAVVHPNEASHEDMLKTIFREVEIQNDNQRQIRLED